MAANTTPIFTNQPTISWSGNLTSGTNNYDGTSGTTLVFTADATDGSYVSTILAKAAGTNVTTNVRLFINNGSTTGTAANNALFLEQTLPAITASATAATANIQIPINIQLPAGYRIYAVLSTGVAAGCQFICLGAGY